MLRLPTRTIIIEFLTPKQFWGKESHIWRGERKVETVEIHFIRYYLIQPQIKY